MNSRERARLILNHQEADRPAIDLGSTVVTGTSAWTYRALKAALSLPKGSERVHELFPMLAEALQRFGNVKTCVRCCGSVPDLGPHVVEADIDCLDPVQ